MGTASLPAPSHATLAERFAAQLLVGAPARDPLEVTRRLLAVQGQDPRGARLAIRARSAGLTAADVEDYPWLHALTTPPLFTASARRLAQEGVPPGDADRGVGAIERALVAEGPLTRAQLAQRIAAAGVRTDGQALVHLLLLASLRGIAVRGPMAGREHAYVHVRDWLGEPPRVDRERALAELGRRYLAGHGPACERDLAKWAGLPLRDARAAFAAIASELVDRENGTVALAGGRPSGELPPPRLLGPFDPVLLGWTSRAALLGAHQQIITVNGLFRPFALVKGRAVATWRMKAGSVQLEPFGRIPRTEATALAAEACDIERFMAGNRPRQLHGVQ